MTIQTNTNLSLKELDLPFPASCLMDFEDEIYQIQGNVLTVGYLADDSCDRNPLEDNDYAGNIYTAHRHSSTHKEMQEALGLNADWDADLDLVEPAQLRKDWIEAATIHLQFQEWATETAGARALLNEAYFKKRATKLYDETFGEYVYNETNIHSFSFTDVVRKNVWKTLRANGDIGTKGAVLLDCYEHSGQVWSITGEGNQCRWDTSTGCGVWTPSNEATDVMNEHAAIYAFGQIHDNGSWTRKSGKKRFHAVLDERFGSTSSPLFTERCEAFTWLSEKAEKLSLPRSQAGKDTLLKIGFRRASEDFANDALALYNDWLSGNVFGVVCASFINKGTPESPVWEQHSSDECWGYYGSDWAMEALAQEMAGLKAA